MPKLKTNQEFIEELKIKNPTIIPLELYINNITKIQFKCLNCNTIYETIPKIVLNGHLCPECGRKKLGFNSRKNSEKFKLELYKLNPNIEILSPYIKSNEKIKCKCKIDGCEWKSTPNNLLRGHGCPECGIVKIKKSLTSNNLEFIKKASIVHKNKYDYNKVQYITTEEKVCIICPKHGEFWLTPHSHLKGYGCPKCSLSKGESCIESYLNLKNIKFTKYKLISVPTNIRPSGVIYVDFYIPEINTIIEYNGEQHYIPIKHFGGEIKFLKLVIRDNWLRNYCIEENINLIEIKYNEDVESVLNKLF